MFWKRFFSALYADYEIFARLGLKLHWESGIMRSKKHLPFIAIALLACSIAHAGPFARWAARGVVVNKTFRPTPLSHSLWLDGIYRLEVRGPDKKVRRQMVTKEVFLAYEIGDEFDEQIGHVAVKGKSVPVEASVQVAATPQSPSLADVLEAKDESRDRLASANFPREMLPETEGF
ncbi:MAG: hypothetical protein M3Q86_08465 [Verrucomicrobiota bacterium]|nr:hypothetical protein [Verrucomicrobiota bacterium]